jgi:hypothetical protein
VLRRPPVRRIGDDRYAVTLGDEERDLLAALADDSAELFDNPDHPGLHRSFPPAYQGVDHLQRAEEWRLIMTSELADKHREALATLADSARATELTGAQLEGWMRALTQLRLVLGTQIGLEGNDDELPDTMEGHLYEYLTYLQSLVVDALSGGL